MWRVRVGRESAWTTDWASGDYPAIKGTEPSGPRLAVSEVRDYILALRRWIRRFRGVATRYLDNHLAWHGILEAAARAADNLASALAV